MLIVGLTGGVASGKSTVSRVLREEGAYLIDADQIARELVQPHTPAWQELIKIFGDEILQKDGSIHRKKLAALVFSNPEKRGLLNQLLHPRIKEETERRAERDRSERPRGRCGDRCSPPRRDWRLSRHGSADRGPFHRGSTDRAVGKKGWNEPRGGPADRFCPDAPRREIESGGQGDSE